jgi:hypothetical protein
VVPVVGAVEAILVAVVPVVAPVMMTTTLGTMMLIGAIPCGDILYNDVRHHLFFEYHS